jgi:hypothetical protein
MAIPSRSQKTPKNIPRMRSSLSFRHTNVLIVSRMPPNVFTRLFRGLFAAFEKIEERRQVYKYLSESESDQSTRGQTIGKGIP